MIINCEICGGNFARKRCETVCWSDKCRTELTIQRRERNRIYAGNRRTHSFSQKRINCLNCGKEFLQTHWNRKHCSYKCKVGFSIKNKGPGRKAARWDLVKKQLADLKCISCGQPIPIYPKTQKYYPTRRKFCSRRCICRWHDGHSLKRKLRAKYGARIYYALKSAGVRKSKSSNVYLGCTAEEYKDWIEEHWLPGMSWGNYPDDWQIDHIQPCGKFDLRIEWHRRLCFHFTNFQPLWRRDNRMKSDNITKPQLSLPI